MMKLKRVLVVFVAFLLFVAYFYTSQMNANEEIENESEETVQEEVSDEILEEGEDSEFVPIIEEVASDEGISNVAYDDSGWGLLANRDTSWSAGSIISAQQLAQFAYLVNNGNNFAGQTVTLDADIDLGGIEWFPIGAGTYDISTGSISGGFSGTFDGNNHTVSNLSIYANHTINLGGSPSVGFSGLFGVSNSGSVIENVTLRGNVRVALGNGLPNGMAGGVVGYHSGVLDNVYNYANVQGQYTTGGLTGYLSYGVIKNSYNYGFITSQANSSSCIGGLSGVAEAGQIISSANYGKVTSAGNNQYVGGLVGTTSYATDTDAFEILGAYNQGEIVISNYTQAAGGIVGYACWLSSIKNVYQAGKMTLSANTNLVLVGQLVGRLGNTTPLGLTHTMHLSDAYYNTDLASANGVGTVLANGDASTQAMDSPSMQAQAFVTTLNTGNAVWVSKANDFPVFGTVVAGADYSAVEDAISHVPVDLSIYTDATVSDLQQAIASVVYGKTASEQTLVDSYAQAINDALQALQLKLIVNGEKLTMFVGETMSLEANLDGFYTHDETKLNATSTSNVSEASLRATTGSRYLTLEAIQEGSTSVQFESEDGQVYQFDLVIKNKSTDPTTDTPKTNNPATDKSMDKAKGIETLDQSNGGLYQQIILASIIVALILSAKKVVRKLKQ